jgi:hypothetical protein
MAIVFGILLVIHMVGWAIVLGGTLTHLRPARIATGVTHGALTAVVAGILMVGLAEMTGGGLDYTAAYAWVAVKLVIGLIITGLAIYGARREEKVTTGLVGGIAGLTVLNIAVAVLWP